MKLSGLDEKSRVLNMNARVITSLMKYHFATFTTGDDLGDYDNIRLNFLEKLKNKYKLKVMNESFFELTRSYLLNKKEFSFGTPGVSVNPKLFNGVITSVNKPGTYWVNRVFEIIRLYNKSFYIQHPTTSKRHYFSYDDEINIYLRSLSKDVKFIDINKSKYLIKNFILKVIDKEYPVLSGRKQVEDIIDHMISTYAVKVNRKVNISNEDEVVSHLLDTNYLNKNAALRKVISETVQLKGTRLVKITLNSIGEELCVMFNKSYKDVEGTHITSVPTIKEDLFSTLDISINIIQPDSNFIMKSTNKRTVSRSVSRYVNYLLEPIVTRNHELITIHNNEVVLFDFETPKDALDVNFSLKQMIEIRDSFKVENPTNKILGYEALDVLINDAKKASEQFNSNFIVGMSMFKYMLLLNNDDDIIYNLFKEMMDVTDGMSITNEKDIALMNSRLHLINKNPGVPKPVGESCVEEDFESIEEETEEVILDSKEEILDSNITIESFDRTELIKLYSKFLDTWNKDTPVSLYQFSVMYLEGLLTEDNVDANLTVALMDKALILLTDEDKHEVNSTHPDVQENVDHEEQEPESHIEEENVIETKDDTNLNDHIQHEIQEDKLEGNIFRRWIRFLKEILF